VLPGITDLAFADAVPTQGTPYGKSFQIAGEPPMPYAERPLCGFKVVSASYFRAVRLHVVAGRPLEDGDRDGMPLVVVINQTMARTYFRGRSPLGERLLMRRTALHGAPETSDLSWTIVGVTADEGVSPFDDRTSQPAVYATREQHPRNDLALVVRTARIQSLLGDSIRRTVTLFDADQAVADLKTVDELKREDVAPDRLRSILLGGFATVAVVLAAIGLYGVLAFAVTQRTREIGIRAALGASAAGVRGLVVGQAMGLIGCGVAAGLMTALVVTRLLRTFLYGVGPMDPFTMAAVAAALTIVGLIACYVPARRATAIDPLIAIKTE
jgi:putative ABC transport system permease protein